MQILLYAIGILLLYSILTAIPAWVYVTLGVVIILLILFFAFDVPGLLDGWWSKKTDYERSKFRKGAWSVVFIAAIPFLAVAFPILVFSTAAIAIATRYYLRYRHRSSGKKNSD